MKRFLPLVLAAMAIAAPVATSPAQNPNAYRGVTIAATPNPVVYAQPVTFTGDVQGAKAGVRVYLQTAAGTAGPWTAQVSTLTTRKGKYSVRHRPLTNTFYRVVAGQGATAAASSAVRVLVRPLVGFRITDKTPSRGERVRFSGIVRPPHNGRLVYLQRQSTAGRWVTVGRTALRALDRQSSRYSLRQRVRRSANYRVRILGHSDHAMGISRTRGVTITPGG